MLEEKTGKPISIFLFGGDGNAAELSMERINRLGGGLRAVGLLSPGHGAVEEVRKESIINAINSAKPNILLVALGAQKGVDWIEKSCYRLNAGVIRHLGATVNFLAGTVQRAPRIMQAWGLEWTWRIFQGPKLFSRYALDGLALSKALLTLFPLWLGYRFRSQNLKKGPLDNAFQYQEREERNTLIYDRCLQASQDSPVRDLFCRAALSEKEMSPDFQATEFVDIGFQGLLLTVQKYQKRKGMKLTVIINVHGRLSKIFNLYCIHGALMRVVE